MSPGQESVDKYLAEHFESPTGRTIRLIREDERAKLRAKVEALPRPRMANDAFVMDERWDLWRAKVLALLDE